MFGTIMTKNKTLYNLEIYRIYKEEIHVDSLFSMDTLSMLNSSINE